MLLLEMQLGTAITAWSPFPLKVNSMTPAYTQQASLLGAHTEERKSLPATAICSPTLTAGFSKVPTMWKECVVDGHMAKICNIFTRECYLALKKECSLAIRLNIDEPGGH